MFPVGDQQIRGGSFPYFSYILIAINVFIFFFQSSLSPAQTQSFIFEFGCVPAEIMRGQDLHTLFTCMFLHGGLMHLVGNMMFLWVFGDNIEAVVGNFRFLLFYILGGLFASAAHIFFNLNSGIPSVGASGAIAAVLGAYLVMFPKSKIKVFAFLFFFQLPAFLFLGIWIVQQFMSGVATLSTSTAESAGVAWWAHIGGFVFGVAAGVFFRPLASPYFHEERTDFVRRITPADRL